MSADQPTREFVEAQLARSPSSASHRPMLEAYVGVQASSVGVVVDAAAYSPIYSFDANRALLKIYQFLPQVADPAVVACVILLSMTRYPASTGDRLAVSYLLTDRMRGAEPTATALRCSALLDECRFASMWTEHASLAALAAEGPESLRALVTGPGRAALQRSVLRTLALTYRSAKLDTVLASADLPSADALVALGEPCVRSVAGDVVTFAETPDNTKRSRVFQEGVSYGAIANMMAKVVAASPQ